MTFNQALDRLLSGECSYIKRQQHESKKIYYHGYTGCRRLEYYALAEHYGKAVPTDERVLLGSCDLQADDWIAGGER